MELRDLLAAAASSAAKYRERVAEARVFPETGPESVRDALGALPDGPTPAAEVVDALTKAAEPALVASTGPRYFGFVTGGALDAATAADVLTTGWDQNGFNAISSPAAAAVEDVAATWLKGLLGLPATASSGFVTGGQAANTVCLAAARYHALARAGWDVERDGLTGAPRIRVLVNADRHATIDRALRLLGLGTSAAVHVRTDAQGRTDVGELTRLLSEMDGPSIVCLQAGDVNTGAFDDFPAAIEVAHSRGAWVHVDGAVGLWAAASPSLRHLTEGVAAADSWSTDGHKWLNVPYDSGYAFSAHPDSHAAATAYTAAYLTGQDGFRAPSAFALESSRRARGFATWAALRQLGRSGIAELVDRCCALARRFAARLADGGVTIGNDVVLNQILAAFGDDERTQHASNFSASSSARPAYVPERGRRQTSPVARRDRYPKGLKYRLLRHPLMPHSACSRCRRAASLDTCAVPGNLTTPLRIARWPGSEPEGYEKSATYMRNPRRKVGEKAAGPAGLCASERAISDENLQLL